MILLTFALTSACNPEPSSTMTLYLDTEFNGLQGALISIALVPQDGTNPFYRALHCPDPIDPWVAEHVMPILGIPQHDKKVIQADLEWYLTTWSEVHIVADWPEDLAHLCNLFITGPGTRIRLPKLTFEIDTVDAPSTLPHNALHDAVGIATTLNPNPAAP